MSVHIGELHTEVVPVAPAAEEDPDTAGDRALADAERTRRLARRVAAEGFDD